MMQRQTRPEGSVVDTKRWLVAALLLACLARSSLAAAQTVDQQLKEIYSKLNLTDARLRKLEQGDRWIGHGRFDRDGLSQSWFRCSSESGTFKTVRPGVFRFEFKNNLLRPPVVIGTVTNHWGDLKIEASSLRAINIEQSGFTIETFRETEPANVAFEFLILRAAPAGKAPECSE
jgi:inhibitor of KinA sporulation pathway (predicted exonuclease)